MTVPEQPASVAAEASTIAGEVLGDEVDQLRYSMDAISNREVLDEVLRQVQRQLDNEERRFGTLNQKAQLLLGQAGAAVTLTGTIAGGALLANSDRIQPWLSWVTSAALAALVVVGVVTTIKAVIVLRVGASAETAKTNLVSLEATRGDVLLYWRFMVVHLWEVHSGLRKRLDRMADQLQCAQNWFIAFLALAGAIGALLAMLPVILHG